MRKILLGFVLILSVFSQTFAGDVRVMFGKKYFISSYINEIFIGQKNPEVNPKYQSVYDEAVEILKADNNWIALNSLLMTDDGKSFSKQGWMPDDEFAASKEVLKKLNVALDFSKLYEDFIESYPLSEETIKEEVKKWLDLVGVDFYIPVVCISGTWGFHYKGWIFMPSSGELGVLRHELSHLVLWTLDKTKNTEKICEAFRLTFDDYNTELLTSYAHFKGDAELEFAIQQFTKYKNGEMTLQEALSTL